MKKLSLLLCSLMVLFKLHAQKAPDWKKDFPSKINWYQVSDAGVLLVATKDALYGLSPEGKEIWKADDIENIKESNMDPIAGTPYIALVKQGTLKGYNKIVDVVTGQTVVNTQDLGLVSVAKRLYLAKSNYLMFYGAGKKGLQLTLVDLTTGKQLWEQRKIFEKQSEQIVSEAGDLKDAVLIATNRNIYKLSKATGDVLFSIDMKSDAPAAAAQPQTNPFAAFSGNAKNSNELQTATSADFFQHEDEVNFYFWNQDILTRFDVATGKETWTRFKLPSPIAYILHDTRGMLVATAEKRQEDIAKANSGGKGLVGRIAKASAAGKNRASLYLIDPANGTQKWDSDIDLRGDILAYKLSGNKLILATQKDNGDNYISIADLDKGASVTKKPLNIKGTIRDLQMFPQGLYFRTTDQINILDLESGAKTWKKGFSVKNCLGYNASETTGYVFANGMIYKIDFKNGDMDEWVKSLKFNAGEEPTSLQVIDKGIFIASPQNAALYDESGNQLYHTYVQAPGRTLTGKILSGLGGVASLAVGAASAAQSAQLSYAKGYYGSTSPALDNKIKSSQSMASAGFSGAVSSFKSISKRFNASQDAANFMSMLTNFGNSNMAKDAGITMIDKTTGKRVADMLLGDKKDPDYMIDDLGRVVYYQSGGTVIEGFRF